MKVQISAVFKKSIEHKTHNILLERTRKFGKSRRRASLDLVDRQVSSIELMFVLILQWLISLLDSELDIGEVVDGKTYKIDSVVYFPHDVVDETTVVDGLGQRLILNIENVRGGGGQRRVSVFAQYWIVNCTEHPLRYKQEKGSTFVSGTVHSPEKDGSLPLSGGRARAKYDNTREKRWDRFSGTIFSGTFGALATSPGRCDLPPDQVAKLIDANLSLENLATLAFMFNFHEGSVMMIGSQRLAVQLGDGTGETSYESDWSRGFSIDSVGISQFVG